MPHQRKASITILSLVTGGSRGLGRNTAVSIARHGGDVILTYCSGKDGAEAVVAEIEAMGRKAVALQLDTSIVSTFPAFVEALRAAVPRSCDARSFQVAARYVMPKMIIHSPAGTFDAVDRQRAAGALMALGLGCEALPHSPMVRSTVWTYFTDYPADAVFMGNEPAACRRSSPNPSPDLPTHNIRFVNGSHIQASIAVVAYRREER